MFLFWTFQLASPQYFVCFNTHPHLDRKGILPGAPQHIGGELREPASGSHTCSSVPHRLHSPGILLYSHSEKPGIACAAICSSSKPKACKQFQVNVPWWEKQSNYWSINSYLLGPHLRGRGCTMMNGVPPRFWSSWRVFGLHCVSISVGSFVFGWAVGDCQVRKKTAPEEKLRALLHPHQVREEEGTQMQPQMQGISVLVQRGASSGCSEDWLPRPLTMFYIKLKAWV